MDRKIRDLFTPQPRPRGNIPLTEQKLRRDFTRKMERIYGHRNASRRHTSHTARNAPLVDYYRHLKYMPGGPEAKLAAKSFAENVAKQKKSISRRKTKSAPTVHRSKSSSNRKTKSAGNKKNKKNKKN